METSHQILSSGEAVARVAYLLSDVIIAVQPSRTVDSEFFSHLNRYARRKDRSLVAATQDAVPEIQNIRHNADPLLSVFTPIRSGRIATVTTTSSILLPAIPHLYRLANYPLVIHVSLPRHTQADFSPVTAIRNCGWTFLQSLNLQEAQDMAITAHALAIRTGKAVVHFFVSDMPVKGVSIDAEDAANILDIIDIESVRRFQSSGTPTSTIYADDGHQALTPHQSEMKAACDAPPVDNLPSSTGQNAPINASTGTSIKSSEPSPSTTPPAPSSAATTVELSPPQVSSDDIVQCAVRIWHQMKAALGRQYSPFEYNGPKDAINCLLIFGSDSVPFIETIRRARPDDIFARAGVLIPRLYRPWVSSKLVEAIPDSVKRIAILEQVNKVTVKWGPLLVDALTSINRGPGAVEKIVGYRLGGIAPEALTQALRGVVQNLMALNSVQNLEVGVKMHPQPTTPAYDLSSPQLETAYTKILDQLFGERAYIANAIQSHSTGVSAAVSASPEYGFGSLLARLEQKRRFAADIRVAVTEGLLLNEESQNLLSRWLVEAKDSSKQNDLPDRIISQLTTDESVAAQSLLAKREFLRNESLWLIGSDAWAFDLGNSGVHHVLASGENVNMLIIDSTPYTEKSTADANRRKKDIGLYAMNFGNVYVASTAVYSSYTQVLQAMLEADKFNGPSVVLAYLPYFGEADSPLTVLQETKRAVGAGYWPLYRWNPENEEKGESNMSLDSELVKQELKTFLARDNQLTQLMLKDPNFAASLAHDFGTEVRSQQIKRAKTAYDELLEGLLGAPLTILFASDNGNASSLAQRLGSRGRARGLKTAVWAMEDYPAQELCHEKNIVFITSTAGQGEFPQNGLSFWDAIKNDSDLQLGTVNFSVFGLGDSHYWPRKEDRIFYNKPAKDLDRLLESLGGSRFADLGLGDDQDADGFQTGYEEWEPKLWTALGVDKVDNLPEEPPPITNEDIKIASNFLRGTITEGLNDHTTGAISASDQQLTKFHGTYMQDDRDVRDERKAQGLEPAYSFMIRCRLPGGVATPEQWLQMDNISSTLGNETMKLTTRQTFQFHGVIKGNLKRAMRAINRALMTTIAACGDVNRNVMCSVLPTRSSYHDQVYSCSQKISDHLLPSTTAYHEIWLTDENDKKTQVAGDAVQDFEPLYGPTYLPRKFKITIAVPPNNDTDVYAHDVGLIAIQGDDTHLLGFNVLAGGGMGATHNNKKTYPQTGRMLGFCTVEEVHIVCEKIMLVQRDHGDRKNRKHARLKYTIDDMGLDVFRDKVEKLWGKTFAPPKPFTFTSNVDTFGWQRDETGLNHFTFFIENGRVEDTADFQMKTGLREIAKTGKGEFRLTGNQHLILSKIREEDIFTVKNIMKQYKLDNIQFSGLRLSSSACVAFPTCGLAMAESERYLPELISKLEACLEENGLRQESIVMRMTGCPNGCARPWLAEVAFVGKAYGAYNMYLGGGYHGQRLNKLYRSSIREDEILEIMKSLLKRYALERSLDEKFGDFCIRVGIIKATTDGKDFHDNVEEDDDEEGD